MADMLAWVKESVKKGHLKEVIKSRTGLTPPAFFAAVAAATAATALAVSVVSSLLSSSPSEPRDEDLDEIMNYSGQTRDTEPEPEPEPEQISLEDILDGEAERKIEEAEMMGFMGSGENNVDAISSSYMEVNQVDEEKDMFE